jgi:hypothetical protein
MKRSALILWQKRVVMLWPFLLLFTIMPWKEAIYNIVQYGIIGWAIILILTFTGEVLIQSWFVKIKFHNNFFNPNKQKEK